MTAAGCLINNEIFTGGIGQKQPHREKQCTCGCAEVPKREEAVDYLFETFHALSTTVSELPPPVQWSGIDDTAAKEPKGVLSKN